MRKLVTNAGAGVPGTAEDLTVEEAQGVIVAVLAPAPRRSGVEAASGASASGLERKIKQDAGQSAGLIDAAGSLVANASAQSCAQRVNSCVTHLFEAAMQALVDELCVNLQIVHALSTSITQLHLHAA